MPPRPSFGFKPARLERVAVVRKRLGKEGAHRVAEDDRVRDLHHRRLEVHREQHALRLRPRDLSRQKLAQRRGAHHRRVHDFARQHRHRLAQHAGTAVVGGELDAQRCRACRSRPTVRWSGSRRRPCARRWSSNQASRRPCDAGARARSFFTDAGARRSELPSRSTGLTALPLTRS